MDAPPRSERRWPARLRSLALNLFLLLALVAALDWYRAPDARAVAVARLNTTQGEAVDFQAQRQPTLLYVWAEWCGYCRHTSPAIERLHRSGQRVVSVAMQSGTDAQVHAYMRKHGLTFPVVNDPDGEISRILGVGVTPTIAIVSDGRMRLATSGWTSEYGLRLRLWLARWQAGANRDQGPLAPASNAGDRAAAEVEPNQLPPPGRTQPGIGERRESRP